MIYLADVSEDQEQCFFLYWTRLCIFVGRGTVYGTGSNQDGQLGLGHCISTASFHLLHPFCNPAPIRMLSAGCNTSAALTGSNRHKQWCNKCLQAKGVNVCVIPLCLCVGQRMGGCSCGETTLWVRLVWGMKSLLQSPESCMLEKRWRGSPVDTTTQHLLQVQHSANRHSSHTLQ